MNSVSIMETTYPCVMYALRRIGSNIKCTSYWLENILPKLLEPYTPHCAAKGDILVWKNQNPYTKKAPIMITEDGHIIWQRIRYNYHIAVYEGEKLISDMVVGEDENWAIPFQIRMYTQTDTSNPDFYIPQKQLINA